MVKDLLHELRRRNVFPILASYAIIGWVVVQVLSIIPQALGLPNWILTLASVLFLAFFPVIIFISWFFDVSLDGITLTPVAENVEATGVGKISLPVDSQLPLVRQGESYDSSVGSVASIDSDGDHNAF